jgi:hypothetical protein
MNIKNIVTKDSYSIEATPLGGYIARPNNPALQPIEGATLEDVQKQIDSVIASSVEHALPDSFGKFGLTSHRTVTKISYRMEEKPEGGFIARPGDPAMGVIEGATREEVQQKLNQKMGAMIGQQLPNVFGDSNEIKVTTNRNVSVQFLHGNSASASAMSGSQHPIKSSNNGVRISFNISSVGRIVRFLAAFAVAAWLMYYFSHR